VTGGAVGPVFGRTGATVATGLILALVAAAVGPEAVALPAAATPVDTVTVTDDLDRRVSLPAPARRIVSLVPAATEILFALGAGDRLVGRTRYGVHPEAARGVPSVGEGVRPSTELVAARDPDLVILYAGEANRSTVRELERLELRTLAMEHDTFDDLYRAIERLGTVTGRSERAARLTDRVRCEISAVGLAVAGAPRPRVYYDVWGDPPITIGSDSYLDSLVSVAGGENVFGDLPGPSPRVSLEAIVARAPDVVVWPRTGSSAEGSRPGERVGWRSLDAVAAGEVRSVDGDLLHRLGPRIGAAARELAAALHPERSEVVRRAGDGCGLEHPEPGT
jgi:ABC-type Fe3+-hydroxamate transport system substrate-binding protein